MTGAGRSPRPSTHAGFVLENVSPYKVGSHQHVAEIAQLLGFAVSFTPHLLPVRRGLLATCNVRSTGADLRELLEEHYASSPVVTVLPEGVAPELSRVQCDRRRRDRRLRRPLHRPHDRHLRPRQPRQGRRRAGGPERQRSCSGCPRRRACGSQGCSSDVGHRRTGLRGGRRLGRDPPVREARRRARPLARAGGRLRDVDAEPRPGRARGRLEAAPRARRAAGGGRQRRRRERRDRRPRRGGRPRDGRACRGARSGSRPEEVVVLSTGVIGPRLPMEKLLAGVDAAAAALSPDGGDAAAQAILTTDNGPKTAVVSRDGFTVGGMAKGAGMIHPSLATMLAVVTTDYPLPSGGDADRVPAPRGRAVVQPDLRRRRLLDERRRRAARERAASLIATRAMDARSPRRSRRCARTWRGRSSPTARARPSSWRSASPVPRRTTRRRRSRAGWRPRRSSRRQPSVATRTGAACSRPPARRRGTAGSRTSTPTGSSVAFDGTPVFETERRPGSSPTLGGAACRIELDLGLGDGEAAYLASRPLVRLREAQRGVHDVSGGPVVLKLGGRVAAGAVRAGARRCRRAGGRRPRRRPADHRRDGASRDRGLVRRRPARDDAGGARGRPRVARRRERRGLRRDRPGCGRPPRRRDRARGAAGRGARPRRRSRRRRRRRRSSTRSPRAACRSSRRSPPARSTSTPTRRPRRSPSASARRGSCSSRTCPASSLDGELTAVLPADEAEAGARRRPRSRVASSRS